MRYAVVACSACKLPWLLETKHARSGCPSCQKQIDVLRRKRYWEGDNTQEGQGAIAYWRAKMQGADPGDFMPPLKLARHDEPLDAVAAKACSERNASRRAQLVAHWMQELVGPANHDAYLEAMGRAGLTEARAEQEITRLLATDEIYEPRAGCYAKL